MDEAFAATWFDGGRPVPRPATGQLVADGVRVEPEGAGAVVLAWRGLVVEDTVPGRVEVSHETDEGVLRLEGSEAVAFRAAFAASPARALATRRRSLGLGVRLAALAAACVAAWFAWPPVADQLSRLVPASLERRLGEAAAASLLERTRECSQPAGRAALDGLVARLLPHVRLAPGETVRVRVVGRSTVNAFAVPGGEVVVFAGLLREAASPGEFAGVLAHELGHVEARHGMRGVIRSSGPAIVLGAVFGGGNLAALGTHAISAGYSRGFEREADEAAARILAEAGIDGRGMLDFFERRRRAEEGAGAADSLLAYASTHPPSAERRAALAGLLRPGEPALDPDSWRALRAICLG